MTIETEKGFFFTVEIAYISASFDVEHMPIISWRGPYQSNNDAYKKGEVALDEWMASEYKRITVTLFIFSNTLTNYCTSLTRNCLHLPFSVNVILSLKNDPDLYEFSLSKFAYDNLMLVHEKKAKKSDIIKRQAEFDSNTSLVGIIDANDRYDISEIEAMILTCARSSDAVLGSRISPINDLSFIYLLKSKISQLFLNKYCLSDPLTRMRFYKAIPFYRVIQQIPSTDSIEWHLNKLLNHVKTTENFVLFKPSKKGDYA